MTMAQIKQELAKDPMTVTELAARTGLSYSSVLRQCRALWITQEIHISAWEKGDEPRSKYTTVYSLGRKKDVEKPPRVSTAEANQAYKLRIKYSQGIRKPTGIWGGLMR